VLAHRFLDPVVDGGDAAEDTRKVGTADAPAHYADLNVVFGAVSLHDERSARVPLASILVFGVRAQHVVVDPAAVAVVPGLGPGALLVGDDLQPYLAHVVWHLGPVLALVRVPPTHDDGHRPRFGNVVVAVDADKGDVVVR